MEHNVYDFDGTIYSGDSTLDFYVFCLMKRPLILTRLPKTIAYFIKFKLNLCSRIDFKLQFYSFLSEIDNADSYIEAFWDKNIYKIKDWYFKQKQISDIIISASPEFLLKPVCNKLGVEGLIASKVEVYTGKILGKNCRGEEKVNRICEEFPNCKIKQFYSDTLSDEPMAKIAENAYFVKKNKIYEWKF